jgi:ELWxxDGT repeat protein
MLLKVLVFAILFLERQMKKYRWLRCALHGLLVVFFFSLAVAPAQAVYPSTQIGLVKDINPGSADPNIFVMYRDGRKIIFTANDSIHGEELWVSDGTSDGTHMIKDIFNGPIGITVDNAMQAGDLLYFAIGDGTYGEELWVTDGSADGTHLVKDMNPGGGSAGFEFLAVDGRRLYFKWANSNPVYEEVLCVTDGTEAGTLELLNITQHFGAAPANSPLTTARKFQPGSNASPLNTADNKLFLVSAGKLYIVIDNGTFPYFAEWWVSAGTVSSTQMLAKIPSTVRMLRLLAGTSRVFGMSAYDGSVDYGGEEVGSGVSVWSTDGSAAGTRVLKSNFFGYWKIPQRILGDTLYFTLANTEPEFWDSAPQELWTANGVSGATQKLYTFPHSISGAQRLFDKIYRFVPANGKMYFFFQSDRVISVDASYTRTDSLWVSSGSTNNLIKLKEYSWNSTTQFLSYDNLGFQIVSGGLLYYDAATVSQGACVMERTDGTAAGTIRVFTSSPPPQGLMVHCPMALQADSSGNGVILFDADGPYADRLLYRSDGTPGGTTALKTIRPGLGSGYWAQYDQQNMFGSLFIVATGNGQDPNPNPELWRTNGTIDGTQIIDFSDGGPANVYLIGKAGKTLLMLRDDNGLPGGDHGRELWGITYTFSDTLYLPVARH